LVLPTLKQLGSDEFEEREAATNALKKVGKLALNALGKAATENADAEVRNRAAALILAIRDSLIRSIDAIKLFLTTWENPNPVKRIVTLDYVATGGTPFCVAISAEN